MYASFAFYLLVAGGIQSLPNKNLARIVVVFFFSLLAYQSIVLRPDPFRVDFASAAHYLKRHATEGDSLVAFKDFAGMAMGFHLRDSEIDVQSTESFDEMTTMTNQEASVDGRTWVMIYQWAHPEWFISRLEDANLQHELYRFGRRPYLMLYRVSTPD